MPLYEYRCNACRHKATLFFRSLSSVEEDPACPTCGAHGMTRLVSRFWSHRSASTDTGWNEDRTDAEAGFGEESYGDAFDEEGDPIEFARQTREMAAAFGEPLEPELDIALRRIESGADPEDVLGELDHAESTAAEAAHDDASTPATEF